MQIIAVDDEKLALQAINRAIKQAAPDEALTSFDSGSKALAFAAEQPVDVAFLDIELRDMNGLDLGRALSELNPEVNIIFTSGYEKYLPDAFAMYASGYILKPVRQERVTAELENLRHPVGGRAGEVRVLTFGNFEVFVDGEPLKFRRSKSKELLAYLIDRQGAAVSRKELAAILWEDEDYSRSKQIYLQAIIDELLKALARAGAGHILVRGYNSLAVDVRRVDCDLYRFLAGDESAVAGFLGEYMSNYSWSELTAGTLYQP